MKNSILWFLLVCLTHTAVKAQVSYGVLLGGSVKDIKIEEDGLSAGSAYSAFKYAAFPLDLGVYVDYGFDASFGIKTNLHYGRTFHEYNLEPGFNKLFLLVDQITLQPMLKYDVNKEYSKGFYLLAGPRASIVVSSKADDSEPQDTEGFYKGSNFGAGIGFGFTFSRTIGFELMGDFSLSNLLDSSEFTTTTRGVSGNFYVNLEPLFKK